MTNEGQLPMMKNMITSAERVGIDMNLFHCYILATQPNCQKYNTFGFKWLTVRKLETILENMELDSEVLWVDNDIVFFENCIQHLQTYSGDFVMQDDGWSPCSGFFFIRSSLLTKQVIQLCIDKIYEHKDDEKYDDQVAFSNVCKEINNMKVTLLPKDQYPNGYVYFNENRKSAAKMVHCNYLQTTAEKEKRLKNHGLWNVNDKAFNLANKYFI